jgi:hypothetical protein
VVEGQSGDWRSQGKAKNAAETAALQELPGGWRRVAKHATADGEREVVEDRREIPRLRAPTFAKGANEKQKSAHSARNDDRVSEAVSGG